MQFIHLIMHCITLFSYSVIINGEARPSFVPNQGLRQRDLLSPYLVILCVEVLVAC